MSGVIIFHFESYLDKYVPVAAIPGVTDLDVAYQATNNIMDSWSMRALEPELQDGHPDLVLLRPLRRYDGREYGHRSTMVGDRIETNDDGFITMHEVSNFGFITVKE
jgi:hypothetical protein